MAQEKEGTIGARWAESNRQLELFRPQCDGCARYRLETLDCEAFPGAGSIPSEILANLVDHNKPYPGDKGLRFVAK